MAISFVKGLTEASGTFTGHFDSKPQVLHMADFKTKEDFARAAHLQILLYGSVEVVCDAPRWPVPLHVVMRDD